MNWVPLLGLLGLLAGAVLRWLLGQPHIADVIWLTALAVGGVPLVWYTTRDMLRGTFAADVVAMLAIVTALIMREYFAGLTIVLMQGGGEALERFALRRASSTLEALLERAPHSAHRKQSASLEEIPIAEVEVGDVLMVRPGDLVPVDGTLLSEQADVDASALTGEPLAAALERGAALLSGSINAGGVFEMAATRRSVDSQYAKMVAIVRAAQADQPPIQRLADRYAVWFTPLTLVMCVIGWLITREPRTVLAVLVVATPCPLILATPIAIIAGINRAARAGIIVKSGGAIERIGTAKVVVFDKTGTLTVGSPVVERVVPLDGLASDGILMRAGSVEQLSSHLLGQVLATAAEARCGSLPLPTHFREVPGKGVAGDVGHDHILVGSPRFLAEEFSDAGLVEAVRLAQPAGTLATMIGINGTLAGIVHFRDRLRPGVPALIARLSTLGISKVVMLTGDSAANAGTIAREAGITDVRANVLPAGKVVVLEQLKQYGTVVMVGDGINDAPALATATVGIAMGARGTAISAEAADMVLLVDDVARVADAIAIGQRTLRIARQSIFAGLGLSFCLMIVASAGLIPPAIGAVCQEVVDVAVILNALRAR